MSHLHRSLAVLALLAVDLAAQRSTMFPPVRGTREMIGAANNQEVEAGYRLLTSGGNAVDAGVAATFAAGVTEQSRFGLGGEMPILIKLAGKPVVAISGIGVAPAKATPEFFKARKSEFWEDPGGMPPIPVQGLRSAITPGVVDGLLLALEKYGTKSFAEVIAPAIECAEGFPIAEEFAGMLASPGFRRTMNSWPDSSRFFYPEGVMPRRGEIVKMPTLAATLKQLVQVEKRARGNRAKKIQAVREAWAKGEVAKKIAKFSEENSGLIAYEDLAKFRAEEDQPRSVTYKGYEIYKPGFWTQGPVMLQALNILEGYDLRAMGHNSAEYLHTVIEAVKLAFADRDAYYGDPKFSKIPEEKLLSKDYAAARRKQIQPQASLESRPGDIGVPIRLPEKPSGVSTAQDTTSISAVDRWGNMFSGTPSGAWLPSVIVGDTGIPLSTRLQSFVLTPGHANELAPGKRPRVTLSPTLVTKNGKPFLVMATPGGDNQDQAMLQVLLNIIEFNMTPQEAAEAPRFQSEHFYSSFGFHEFTPGRVNLEGRIAKTVIDSLNAMGHKARGAGDWSNGSSPTVILVGDDGVLHGAADPRRARFIFGR